MLPPRRLSWTCIASCTWLGLIPMCLSWFIFPHVIYNNDTPTNSPQCAPRSHILDQKKQHQLGVLKGGVSLGRSSGDAALPAALPCHLRFQSQVALEASMSCGAMRSDALMSVGRDVVGTQSFSLEMRRLYRDFCGGSVPPWLLICRGSLGTSTVKCSWTSLQTQKMQQQKLQVEPG